VKDAAIDGTDPHLYVVNLKNVANAQHIFVTLHGVQDSAGHSSDVISVPMSVLLADVDGSGRVDSADVYAVRQHTLETPDGNTFRNDIDVTNRIDSTDVYMSRQQTLTGLP
jgi:hypothetical protein